jgi:uncharacterized protein
MMKINISNLSEGVRDYHLTQKSEELGLDGTFSGEVQAWVTIEKIRHQFFLKAKVSAHAHLECARCLDPVERDFVSEFQTVYVQNAEEYQGQNEDELRILHHDTNIIDFSEDVKDFILLSIPLKIVCDESCQGLCPRCGRKIADGHSPECSLNETEIDSRWITLRELTQKKDTER